MDIQFSQLCKTKHTPKRSTGSSEAKRRPLFFFSHSAIAKSCAAYGLANLIE